MSRFGLVGVAVLACGILTGAASGGSAAALFGASPGGAVEASGLATLNTGGDASLYSVSCAAAGDCAAGGFYSQGQRPAAFVIRRANGSWGHAIKVPGTATLSSGAWVGSVSCGAAGDCAAGGAYRDGSGHVQALVISETNGSWGDAIEVPGTATLSTGGDAALSSVSCAAAGDCTAGGSYRHGSGNTQAFVVSETNGSWGDAIEVPGMATLSPGGGVVLYSISCAAAGDCTAGGSYLDGSFHAQAFVVSETNGSWGDAIEVPGLATLNTGGDASLFSVSCAAAGDCAAGGSYVDGSDRVQAFVVSETNGSWGDAIQVPGTANNNVSGFAAVYSVSCIAAGDCTAGGTSPRGKAGAFVVTETNGSWGNAIHVPGTARVNTADGGVYTVSCAAAGDCAAGGSYLDASGKNQAFVVGETNGSWGTAIEVPGTATLNTGGSASVRSISCAAAGECAAGGYFAAGGSLGSFSQAFVVSETNGSWGNAIARNLPGSCVVPNVVRKALRAAKRTLNVSQCGLGRIARAYSKVRRGRVVAQQPKPGKVLNRGAKVALTVSRGTKT